VTNFVLFLPFSTELQDINYGIYTGGLYRLYGIYGIYRFLL